MEKLITVCIPAYNARDTINECLQSLTDDRYVNELDVIIVNNSSTDNTVKIAESYLKKWPDTFRIIHSGGRQIGLAYNLAIENACGKYMIILDDDDKMIPDGLFCLMEAMRTCESDLILYCDLMFGLKSPYKGVTHKEIFTNRDLSEVITTIFIGTHTTAFLVDMLRGGNVYAEIDFIQYADAAFLLRCIYAARTVSAYNIHAYGYRISVGQGLSNAGAKRFHDDLIKSTLAMMDIYHCYKEGEYDSNKLSCMKTRVEENISFVYNSVLLADAPVKTVRKVNDLFLSYECFRDLPLHTRIISKGNAIAICIMKFLYLSYRVATGRR